MILGLHPDSGTWIQVREDLQYTPKVFDDPKHTLSDKENDLVNESHAMIVLNDLNIMNVLWAYYSLHRGSSGTGPMVVNREQNTMTDINDGVYSGLRYGSQELSMGVLCTRGLYNG